MTFADIRGNDKLVQTLVGMIDSARIPHAIMFHEDDGGGAFPLCIAFLQYLYCRNRHDGDSCNGCPSCNKIGKHIHPDVHYILPMSAGHLTVSVLKEFRELAAAHPRFRESELNAALDMDGKNSMIAVGEARQLLSDLSLSALEGGYRSVVIYLPEKMNAEAANKLLKLIEEPPRLTQFLLITHAPERVLPTIASRCQRLRVLPGSAEYVGTLPGDDEYAPLFYDLMDSLLAKNLLSCLDAGEKIAALPSRENVKAFCNFAAGMLRSVFLLQQGLAPQGGGEKLQRYAAALPRSFPRKSLEVLDRTRSLIDRNVNVKIALTDLADRLWILL